MHGLSEALLNGAHLQSSSCIWQVRNSRESQFQIGQPETGLSGVKKQPRDEREGRLK
jgi:hypothetical protein